MKGALCKVRLSMINQENSRNRSDLFLHIDEYECPVKGKLPIAKGREVHSSASQTNNHVPRFDLIPRTVHLHVLS